MVSASSQVYLGVIAFAGLFEMWAAATICNQLDAGNYDACQDEYAWAVAVGAISTVVCLICAIVLYAAGHLMNDTGHMVVSILLVCLWLPGVIWCTFSVPFPSACGSVVGVSSWYGGGGYAWASSGSANGYFGTWIAFFAAVKYMLASIPALETPIKSAAGGCGLELLMLFLFSIIEMSQAALDCGNNCTNILGWAVACGVISAVICILLFIPQLQPAAKFLFIFLVLLWFAGVATLTFNYYSYSAVQHSTYVARRRTTPVYSARRRAPYSDRRRAPVGNCGGNWASYGCPNNMCPYSDTPTQGVCSCGTSWLDANTRGKRCPRGSRRNPILDQLPGPNTDANTDAVRLPEPARRTTNRRRGNTVNEFGIYSSANNGFFGTWFAFFISVYLCYMAWFGGSTSNSNVALVIIFFASVFEMWAAATLCHRLNDGYSSCQDENAWAVAVGAISAIVCLVMGILFHFAPGIAGQANKFVAVFLFLLWIAGAGVVTFDAPFTTACSEFANGYFSSWVCFVVSFYYMYVSVPEISSAASKAPPTAGPILCACLLASFVVMIQSSISCSQTWGGCTNVMAWAVACSVISIVACVLCLIPQVAPYIKFIAAFLTLLWFVGVATLTYTYESRDAANLGIFSSSGNGFFGTWIAFFSAILLCYIEAFGGSVDAVISGGQAVVTTTKV